MTTTQPETPAPLAVYRQFGQALAFAERTLTDQLREHLAERDTKPETWYALKLIAGRGPGLAREELTQVLEGSRNLETGSARKVLARLEADGLIRGDAQVDFTQEGETLYRSLREYISTPTTRLLSQFEIADIETTVRTLQAITERASEEAAESGV